MIQMVALDIDGTLLPPHVHVDTLPDSEMTQAIQELQNAGVIVVLATGRMFPGAAYIAEHLNIQQPLICQQGASVHHLDGSLLYNHTVDHNIALELCEYAASHNWPMAWFDSHRYVVTSITQQGQFFADVSRTDIECVSDPRTLDILPTGVDIISTREDSRDIHVLLEARYSGQITLLDFPSVTAIHSPAASKGNAIRDLSVELGISQDDVLAIGDSVNDVSMLSWAGNSAAPAHSDRYALDSAKEVLVGEGVDGVAARLRAILD